MKYLIILCLGLALPMATSAEERQEGNDKTPQTDYRPEIHGTIRGKYEYQPEMNSGRFEVRNARFSLSGKVAPVVSYKAEIDLSDEGNIKMLDAYARITPLEDFNITVGQMRVPFTIDAHRSPYQQYFANRSFIAKQVANVRDVGLTLDYKLKSYIPVILQAGLFNGSGLTNQKDFWTKNINYSAKVQFCLPKGFNIVVSGQKIKPEEVTINMFDIGANYSTVHWHIEAEYLLKHYSQDDFDNVNAFNSFVCYDLPLKKVFHKISFLGRFDYMENHSNGTADETGHLTIDDSARKRITGGITLSIAKPFIADLRLNYEKYFYRTGATVKPSEHDKIVAEVMVRF